MKKIAALFAMLVFVIGTVSAQSLGGQVATTAEAEAEVDPGITPDSPFYGLDVAFDRIELALTFGAEAKSEKALEKARERLAEVRAMLEQRKDAHAEKAAEEHASFVAEAEANVDKIEDSSADKELEAKTKIEAIIAKHRERIDKLREKLAEKEAIITKMRARIDLLEAKLEAAKERTEEKLRERGLTEEEIQQKIEKASEKFHEKLEERASGRIEDAKEAIAEAEEEVEENTTAARLLAEAELKLERAEAAFEEKKLGHAYGQATAAEHLAKNAKRIAERDDEEEAGLEIKVKTDSIAGISEVRLEHTFALEATEELAIREEIATKSTLTKEQVEAVAEFEEDDVEQEEKLEIRVEDGVAKIEQRFTLSTIDTATIINEIVARSVLTADDVKAALEIETEASENLENIKQKNTQSVIEQAEDAIEKAEEFMEENPDTANIAVKVDSTACGALMASPTCPKVETTPEKLLEEAKNSLALAKEALEKSDFGTAYTQARLSSFAATQAYNNAKLPAGLPRTTG